jgi:hypothetical protein
VSLVHAAPAILQAILEPAMNLLLVVGLMTACTINVASVVGHLGGVAG